MLNISGDALTLYALNELSSHNARKERILRIAFEEASVPGVTKYVDVGSSKEAVNAVHISFLSQYFTHLCGDGGIPGRAQ